MERTLEAILDSCFHHNAILGVVDTLDLPETVDMGHQIMARIGKDIDSGRTELMKRLSHLLEKIIDTRSGLDGSLEHGVVQGSEP